MNIKKRGRTGRGRLRVTENVRKTFD